MIFVCIALALILPFILYVMLECGVSPAAISVISGAAYLLIISALIIYEEKKRRGLGDRFERLLDNSTSAPISDDSLTAAENRFLMEKKALAIREEKLRQGYSEIGSLISDISHQCKTPLAAIIMYSELLGDSEYARQIIFQSRKLKFLLESLSKAAKCEGGLVTGNLSPKENSISELICTSVGEVFPAAENKGIKIVSETDELFAVFDMSWTAEAMFNLLENAVKYSPENGVIEISAERYDMFVRINVKDGGIGIPEDEICNIWKRFYRGSGEVREQSGAGIGLYLTRLIITSEGGRVSVESRVGEGSTFSIFLPRTNMTNV